MHYFNTTCSEKLDLFIGLILRVLKIQNYKEGAPAATRTTNSSKLRLGRPLQIYFILSKTCLDIFARESRRHTIADWLGC